MPRSILGWAPLQVTIEARPRLQRAARPLRPLRPRVVAARPEPEAMPALP
jgi:hypothetical protein